MAFGSSPFSRRHGLHCIASWTECKGAYLQQYLQAGEAGQRTHTQEANYSPQHAEMQQVGAAHQLISNHDLSD
jgi:hypothetical protein